MKEIKEFIQELCDCAKPSANGSVRELVQRCREHLSQCEDPENW